LPWCIFDIAGKEQEIAELEQRTADPDLWQDPSAAQDVMKRLADRKKVVESWRQLEKKVADIAELALLAAQDEASSLGDEIEAELEQATAELEQMEFRLSLSGRYDSHNAIIAIHAGAGGVESQDWAEMLLRMYLRWAELHDYKTEVFDTSPGEEAGIKSAIIEVSGEYAFGYLKSEHGVHRLIRLSPFDADHARHTSFALVEIMPEADTDIDIDIPAEDIKVETFRSSGPGGQHMQKTSSAVRIIHIPTGITASCQSERSQYQNKESAMRILQARLLKAELARQEEERAKLKGKRIVAGWGNQIRSYILHPYRMVKDHRTDFQAGDADAVLDGKIDDFITAYLRAGLGREDDD
jgi:peptide chain release factor 2